MDEEDPGDEQLVPTPTTAKPQTKKEAITEPEPEPEPEPQPDDAP